MRGGKHRNDQHRRPERYTYAERNALPEDIQQNMDFFFKFKVNKDTGLKTVTEGAQCIRTNLVSSFITTLSGQGPFIHTNI